MGEVSPPPQKGMLEAGWRSAPGSRGRRLLPRFAFTVERRSFLQHIV
jgi:hypothetical protein